MIYLDIFLTFLKIGAISFGGGYGMIPLIKEEVLSHEWLTEPELLNFIAVSESTPGPLAVNMATFIGSTQGGFLGAFLATLGVILPSFIIILLIAAILKNLLKYKAVDATLNGIKPTIIGLIIGTAITMMLSNLLGFVSTSVGFVMDYKIILIFIILSIIYLLYKAIRKKNISPILLILLSAGLGIIFYGLIP